MFIISPSIINLWQHSALPPAFRRLNGVVKEGGHSVHSLAGGAGGKSAQLSHFLFVF